MKQVIQFPTPQPTVRHVRVGFETIPANLSRAELFRYFTFPEPDRREITQCCGESNKIGFALLLGAIRRRGLLGRSARGKSSQSIVAMSVDGSASYADGAKRRWQEIARRRPCARIMHGAYTWGRFGVIGRRFRLAAW